MKQQKGLLFPSKCCMIKWLTGPNFPEVVDCLQNAPGDEIALAAYPMLEKQLVLFANSRRSLCPWRGLLCRSTERILCVVFTRSSSTLLTINVALNPGPRGRRAVLTCPVTRTGASKCLLLSRL